MRRAYREGFFFGYERGMSHFINGPMAGPSRIMRPWDAVPDEFDVLRRQGFHDGLEGARRDYENHRRPDVDETATSIAILICLWRRRKAYREGFVAATQVGINHMMGGR